MVLLEILSQAVACLVAMVSFFSECYRILDLAVKTTDIPHRGQQQQIQRLSATPPDLLGHSGADSSAKELGRSSNQLVLHIV